MNRDIAKQIATLLNTQNKLVVPYNDNKVLKHANNYIFLLEDGTKVVGAVEVNWVQWYQCEICHLSVVHKRRGIGSSLLKKAIAKAQNLGGRVLQCTIRVGNKKSEGFFKHHGFKPTVTFKNHNSGNRVTVYQKVLSK